jgi:hypothetical protein
MIKSLFSSFLLVFCFHFVLAQQQPTALHEPDTIPITLTEYNNILVQTVLNSEDTLNMMLHTAISGVSVTKEATANIKSMTFDAIDTLETWGGSGESRYSANNSLNIGRFHWDDFSIWESQHSGHHSDGKFGLNLFKGKIVELNIEQGYMVIHSSLPSIEAFTSLKVIKQHGMMFIEGDCKIGEQVYPNTFLVHTGYSGSLLLDDAFVEKNGLEEQVNIVDESILKDSYGNELRTLKAVMPAFQLGEIEFEAVDVGFFAGAINRQKMSVMGGGLLKRFHIIFDEDRSTIYVSPNG